jgi:hypothetical protein
MERTTDLKKLKQGNGHNFVWGYVLRIHEIGEYTIVEYHPWKRNGSSILTGEMDPNEIEYSCYLNSKSIGVSAQNMDEALVICIAYKHDGANSQAAYYFMKMIKKEAK